MSEKYLITSGEKYPFISHTFKIVNKIDHGYFVWNIGEHIENLDYIPLCQKLYRDRPHDYSINNETLQAIFLGREKADILRNAAHFGCTSLKDCQLALKRTPQTEREQNKHDVILSALKIFQEITL